MAKKYIDAGLLKDNLRASCLPIHEKGISGCLGDNESIADVINDQPAADVQEVRRGHWISVEDDVIFKCSKCDAEISTSWDYDDPDMFNYCPCCGARMGGENND